MTRRRLRFAGGVAVACLAVLLAGCGTEDAQQEAAREEVQAHVRALRDPGYDAEQVHCTDAAATWFREVETEAFVCAVGRTAGGCDWFAVQVDRERRSVDVWLDARDAGCTLPL
jgi:hypothetical protein